MHRFKRFAVIGITIISMMACHTQEKTEKNGDAMLVDMNGMILGDDSTPPKILKVKMGETLDQLRVNNPYIPEDTTVDLQRGFYLPMYAKLQLQFDDGDMQFDVPCSEKIVLHSGGSLTGLYPITRYASATLCGDFKDDWKSATKLASDIVAKFERQNPSAQNAKTLQAKLSLDELKKISDYFEFISKPWRHLEFMDEAQANAFFEEKAKEGHLAQMEMNQNTLVECAAYVGKTSLVRVGIEKNFYYGGRDSLPDKIKSTMRYKVSISFSRRLDIGEPRP